MADVVTILIFVGLITASVIAAYRGERRRAPAADDRRQPGVEPCSTDRTTRE